MEPKLLGLRCVLLVPGKELLRVFERRDILTGQKGLSQDSLSYTEARPRDLNGKVGCKYWVA
jgi:hypothetical protein